MEELVKFGIKNNDLKDMVDINNDIVNLDDTDIKEMISILKDLGCSDKKAKNIIIENPMYLSRIKQDVLELIDKLLSLGLERLDITFDTNPWLLNLDAYEIDEFIEEKEEEGLSKEEIIDLIDAGEIECY